MRSVVSSSLAGVMEAHYGELCSFARRKLANPALAEDLVQEAFLRLSNAAVQDLQNPRAFLYRILGNLLIDHSRQEKVRARYFQPLDDGFLEVADVSPSIERQLEARQELKRLAEAVGELPERCRECFILRRFEGLSQEEISRRMGISRNMVEKHLRRALVHCAQRLSGDPSDIF